MGKVIAVCTSERKGIQKTSVPEIKVIEDWGIEGDAHAGKWHRQVSLLSFDKIEDFRARGAEVEDGAFGENLVVQGIDFATLPIGTKFQCNDVVLELTQIGKECHSGCAIFKKMGECIMPKQGVFTKVLHGGVIHPGETQEQGGQAGGMSICTDTYKADPSLILGYHVVPGKWLLQGGTTGGGGVMRWFEREFAAYERSRKADTGKSSLEQLNEIAEAVPAGSEGVVFLPYMSGERSPVWNPYAKGVFYGLDFAKTKGHMVRACMEGVAFSLRHNLEVAEAAGAKAEVLRAMGGSANSLLWTQIKADVTGKAVVVPASDTATTLGAAILAGVGVGFYKDYEEAVSMTVKETRRHEPNPENKEVYNKTYRTYRDLYESLKAMMVRK